MAWWWFLPPPQCCLWGLGVLCRMQSHCRVWSGLVWSVNGPLWSLESQSEATPALQSGLVSVFCSVGTLSGKQAAKFLCRFGLCCFFYGYQVGMFNMF